MGDFGRYLRAARIMAGYHTQAAAAAAVGLSEKHYQRLESGRSHISRVSFGVVCAICTVFDLTLDDLKAYVWIV